MFSVWVLAAFGAGCDEGMWEGADLVEGPWFQLGWSFQVDGLVGWRGEGVL